MLTTRPNSTEGLHLLNGVQAILGNALDVIFVTSPEGQLLQSSGNCKEAWGYLHEEIVGKNFLSFIHPDDRAQVEMILKKLPTYNGVLKGEARFRRKDGSWLPVRLSLHWSAEERVLYVLAKAVADPDITSYKKNHEDLEKRFPIFAASPVATSVSRIEAGTFLYVNDAFCELAGLRREQIIGKTAVELEFVNAPQRQLMVQHALQGGPESRDMEMKFRRVNGVLTDVLFSVTKIEIEGEVCLATYIIDISDRKKAEAQVRELNETLEKKVKEKTRQVIENEKKARRFLNCTQEGIYILDASFTFDLLNPAGQLLLQKTTGHLFAPGDNLLNNLPPERSAFIRKIYTPVFKGETLDFEKDFETPGGTIWLSTHVEPLLDEAQQVAGIMVSVRDITGRKEAELALKTSEQKYRYLFENMHEGAQLIDHNWRYVLVNNSVVKQSKYTADELLGHTMQEKYPGIENTKLFRVLEQCKRDRTATLMENEFIFPDGTRACFELSIQPVPEGLFILSIDITERKKAEGARTRLLHMLQRSLNEIYTFNADTLHFEYVNTGALNNLGYSEEELCAMTPVQIKPEYTEDSYRKLVQPLLTHEKEKIIFFAQQQRKDGTMYPVEVHLQLMEEETGNVFLAVVLDITQRRRAEERLEMALDAGQIGIWEVNVKDNTVTRNLKHDQILGHKELLPEWTLQKFLDQVYPADRAAVDKTLEEAAQGHTFSHQFRIVWPDGSIHWVSSSGKANHSHETGGLTLLGTLIDVTQRKEHEEALIRANERFNLAAEASFDVIYDIDIKTNTVSVNEAITSMIGLESGEGFDVDAMRNCIHPEDKEQYLAKYKKFLQTRERYFVHSHRLVKTDGQVIEVTMKALAIRDMNCAPYRIVGVLRDITEQKQAEEALKKSEEQYRKLFHVTPLPAWVVNNETQEYLAVNDAAIEHYGYSRDEFLHMHVRDLMPPGEMWRYLDKVAPENRDTLTGKQGIWKHRKKDGSVIDVEITSHGIFYNQKEARLAIANDVTEKKKWEEELKSINEDLHLLSSHLQNVREEERINIAREIHDDLGQQLTGLKMDMFWLAKKMQPEEDAIREKAKNIIVLIDEIVKSVRRISTNLRPSILDDLGLVPALEWHSKEVARRAEINVVFKTTVEATIPTAIATGLFRIYQEALTNAIRHANAHQIIGSLQLVDHVLILHIEDDGVGMDLDTISSKKTLGLIGIKERTYLLGGKLDLQSRPGWGTELTVSVPI